ncbi:hypothetical protein DAPPUDRAFT_250260 [Daphnia pulex]|uniref:Uncharacterized protein n=1 Tax=Daphnia pulex TaxID=6669 RepID=E9GY74_DAPPU|nr:hypothetical protein DAPPUDRAFT_250260 [Daphnia pulex]|eukprot:EFX75613.1 hypothetical protein DAPPUDRAFT_250260 [Daphnia pulex]
MAKKRKYDQPSEAYWDIVENVRPNMKKQAVQAQRDIKQIKNRQECTTCRKRNMADEFLRLLNRTDLPAVIVEVDTTFDMGNYYVTWVTFRHVGHRYTLGYPQDRRVFSKGSQDSPPGSLVFQAYRLSGPCGDRHKAGPITY